MLFLNKEKFLDGGSSDNLLSKNNLLFLIAVLILTLIVAPSNKLDWIGVVFMMFSTMSNDSIQTLGTFITSNSKKSWIKLWLYISILFLTTLILTWFFNGHRIDFNRLLSIPYQDDNDIMHFVPPFLILSVFASQRAIGAVLIKTLGGYIVGFILSYILWRILLKFCKIFLLNEGSTKRMKKWKNLQWISTGILWIAWLTNNTANVAVYLPRTFSIYSLILFAFIGIIFIGFIFYNHGGPIQEIVSKKKDMTNTRSTSIINLSFAFIIFVFGQINHIPMATTWVFIGILAGRELCIAQLENDGVLTLKERYKHARKLIFKDLILAGLGIAISLSFTIINNNYFQ